MIDVDRTLSLAKRGELSKSELYSRMQAIAEARRDLGESTAQSFARFIATDAGREMLQIEKAMPGRDIDPAPVAAVEKRADTWDDLIRALMRANSCTYSKAVDLAMSSEAGMFALQKRLRSDRIAADVGFSAADLRLLDSVAVERDQDVRLDLHKRAPKHEFEVMVDNMLQKFPHLTRSKAMDQVRATPDGLEAWTDYKKMGSKKGTLPQPAHKQQAGDERVAEGEATSMRTPPLRKPMWQSDHSGSPATTR
jgi:hypothetical protein